MVKLSKEKVFVKDNTSRVIKAESEIKQQANEISARVKETTFNALVGRVEEAESSLTIQAGQISSKVSTIDYTGNKVASLINQTSTTVKIKAQNIELEGIVTANSNFRVLLDGSIEAKNATLTGAITATKISSSSNSNLYAQMGASGGYIGMGLYDKNAYSTAFCSIYRSGNGFLMRDSWSRSRYVATDTETTMFDYTGQRRVYSNVNGTTIYSPNGKSSFSVGNNYAQVVVDGVVKASW